MKKYIVINKETNQVVCKKKGKKRYRQSFNAIEKDLKIAMFFKENAQAEADYLNKEYYTGWEIQEVTGNE